MAELLPHSAAAIAKRTEVQQLVRAQVDAAEQLVLSDMHGTTEPPPRRAPSRPPTRQPSGGAASAGAAPQAMQELLERLRGLQPKEKDVERADKMEHVLATMMGKLEQLSERFGGLEASVKEGHAEALADRQRLHAKLDDLLTGCLLYTSPSPRDRTRSRMPSSA